MPVLGLELEKLLKHVHQFEWKTLQLVAAVINDKTGLLSGYKNISRLEWPKMTNWILGCDDTEVKH